MEGKQRVEQNHDVNTLSHGGSKNSNIVGSDLSRNQSGVDITIMTIMSEESATIGKEKETAKDSSVQEEKNTMNENPNTEPSRSRNIIGRLVTILKYSYSLSLLVFSLILVIAAIFRGQTTAANFHIPPTVAFFIFWFLIFWLAIAEGGQGALVGLRPIQPRKYLKSHRRTWISTKLAHRGKNMERFIVGRQFLVVLIVSAINLMASSVRQPTEQEPLLGLPALVVEIFLNTGLALILVTIIIGQLTAQVNAAICMLDFCNNYLMIFTTYVSLGIEFSGLLHSVYLVQILFSKIACEPTESAEPQRNLVQNVFFGARVFISLCILAFCLAVTFQALFEGNTAMWAGVPPVVSVIIFILLLCFVGMMEGMQIALFAVMNLPEEDLQEYSIAHANCQLIFRDQNLQAFLIGRQICVTICMFVVARITTLDIDPSQSNIFGVSDGLQEFFNTGLLGAVITTIVGSLAWRIIASSFPLAFLSNPLIYMILRLCLILEASGVCSAAWILGRWNRFLARFQPDDSYNIISSKSLRASIAVFQPDDSYNIFSSRSLRATTTTRDSVLPESKIVMEEP